MNKKGLVLSIEKASIHDGPGLRTTVFLKGCPLHCLWCHNPESQSVDPELYYFHERCTYCGKCAQVCPEGCHRLEGEAHSINRVPCTGCASCVRACPYSALELKGECMEAEAILTEAEKDRAYYEASGGGLTISGGEPMLQYDFTHALLAGSKERGFHNCLETCGYAPVERYRSIREYVDLFLYDYKETDTLRHQFYTGVSNFLLLKNLYELDQLGSKLILRCPVIPGLNDRMEHFQGIAGLANRLANIREVNLMPYHSFGSSKSARLGREYPAELEGVKTVEKQQADRWVELVQEMTGVPVKRG
ncbi:pyruvate formate lyase activating enzyme [Anaerotaenia torta]|uniref:glycyl-radical enzyme activating protein n=1 Tax=Anaerotaenia torta TaxID=433293 RepID=UPI003D21FFC5